MNSYNRRAFCKNLSLSALSALCPMDKLFLQILNGVSTTAYAQEDKLNNYVLIVAGGGPNRRIFDTILKVSPEDELLTGNAIASNFKNYNATTGSFDLDYRTTLHKGLYLPYLNKIEVSLSSGVKELKHLMDNAFFLRGVDMANSGHSDCLNFITEPVPGGITTTGFHSDLSNRLFPHLSYRGGTRKFRSAKGLSPLEANHSSKPFFSIFSPAMSGIREEQGMSYSSGLIEEKIDSALSLLKEMSIYSNPKAKTLYSDQRKAKKMFKTAVAAFDSDFSEAKSVYEETIRRTLDSLYLEDLFDEKEYRVSSSDPLHKCASRPIYNTYWNETYNNGSAPLTNRLSLEGYAQSLAFAEIALKHKLTNSIALSEPKLGNIFLKQSSGGTPRKMHMASDAHGWAAVPLMYFNSMRFAGSGAATLEFVERLKRISSSGTENLFDKTIIHLCSEFPNLPISGIDSGHGAAGNQATFLSGKFKTPKVIGNIKKGSLDSHWQGTGTWGEAGPVDALDGKTLNKGNLASTICKLLGCPSPVPNSPSVVDLDHSGDLINLIDDAKLVE